MNRMTARLALTVALIMMITPCLQAGVADLLPRLRLPSPSYTPSKAFALEGWVDHTSTWVADSSAAGSFQDDISLHTGRLILGAGGQLAVLGDMRYTVRAGATLAQNSLYEQRVWTPELEARISWAPVEPVRLGAFARHGWRRANGFIVDSLRRRDLVAGLSLTLEPLEHTELSLIAGNRLILDEEDESRHSFMRAELEQRLPFLEHFLVRMWGESAWYGLEDSLDYDHQRSLGGLTLGGRLPGDVHINSHNTYVYRDGVKRVVGENRLRTHFGEHQRLSANAGADFSELREDRVYRRHADIGYRWMPWQALGSELKLGNERVLRNDADWIHRRTALLSAVWGWQPLKNAEYDPDAAGSWAGRTIRRSLHMKRELSLAGHLGGGYMQSLRHGDGYLAQGELDLSQPVEITSWLAMSFREHVTAEMFHMKDRDLLAPDADLNQVEAENLLSLGTTLFPQRVIRFGHRIDWRRHVGSSLMFSEDTLRNTMSNELWASWRGHRLRTDLSVMFINHLVKDDPIDREERFSLRIRYQPVRTFALNLQGVYRPGKGGLDERLWVRAYADYELNKLRLSADLRFTGDADDFGSRDTQAWVHVLRKLW